MRKRQRLVLTTLILSLGLWGVQLLPLDYRYSLLALHAGVTWVLSAWALREGLNGVEWVTVLIPSVLFSVGTGMFYILLPQIWWVGAISIVLYGIGQYALLLTANIFSVAAIRTIALFRAASAVQFAMTLLTAFLLFNTILSFRLNYWLAGLTAWGISFLLLLPGIWSVHLETKLSKQVMTYSWLLSMMIGIVTVAISFWPVGLVIGSLFLSTVMYIYLGITQHHFAERLFKKTVWEYVTIGMVVLITVLATSGWGS